MKMTFQKQKVFYLNKERYLKLHTEMSRHDNLTILFTEVSKLPSSLDLKFKTNFQNKAERLVYVEKYKLRCCIILDSVTCQDLLNYSYLLNYG